VEGNLDALRRQQRERVVTDYDGELYPAELLCRDRALDPTSVMLEAPAPDVDPRLQDRRGGILDRDDPW
jgi:hypothetical protein